MATHLMTSGIVSTRMVSRSLCCHAAALIVSRGQAKLRRAPRKPCDLHFFYSRPAVPKSEKLWISKQRR